MNVRLPKPFQCNHVQSNRHLLDTCNYTLTACQEQQVTSTSPVAHLILSKARPKHIAVCHRTNSRGPLITASTAAFRAARHPSALRRPSPAGTLRNHCSQKHEPERALPFLPSYRWVKEAGIEEGEVSEFPERAQNAVEGWERYGCAHRRDREGGSTGSLPALTHRASRGESQRRQPDRRTARRDLRPGAVRGGGGTAPLCRRGRLPHTRPLRPRTTGNGKPPPGQAAERGGSGLAPSAPRAGQGGLSPTTAGGIWQAAGPSGGTAVRLPSPAHNHRDAPPAAPCPPKYLSAAQGPQLRWHRPRSAPSSRPPKMVPCRYRRPRIHPRGRERTAAPPRGRAHRGARRSACRPAGLPRAVRSLAVRGRRDRGSFSRTAPRGAALQVRSGRSPSANEGLGSAGVPSDGSSCDGREFPPDSRYRAFLQSRQWDAGGRRGRIDKDRGGTGHGHSTNWGLEE